MKRLLSILVVGLVLLWVTPLAACSPLPSESPDNVGKEEKPVRDAGADSIFSREYIALYNDYRVSQGRSPLNFYSELNTLAAARAAEILESPDTPTTIDPNAVWQYVVYLDYSVSPQDLLDTWADPKYSDWMTRQMMLDWYPRAGFAKVGGVAVHLFVR